MFVAFLAAAFAQTVAPQATTAPQARGQQAAPANVARIRPSPALVAAYQAWGKCMDERVTAVPTTETPEAAAPKVVAACATQQQAMTTAGETWITGLNLPAPQQAQLRTRLAQETTGLEQRVIARLRALRAPPRPAVQGR